MSLVSYQDDFCLESKGQISLNIAGGIAPFELSWYIENDSISLGTIVVDSIGIVTLDSLDAGTYCFKIVDFEGCEN